MRTSYVALLGVVSLACGSSCPERVGDAVANCESACDEGDAEACARLGIYYESGGESGLPSRERARAAFERGCSHGGPADRWTCVAAATVTEEVDATALQRLCQDGELVACREMTRSVLVSESIPVQLPSAEPERVEGRVLSLALDGAGELFLDAEPITIEQLGTRTFGPDTRAVIAADRQSLHADLIAVIDALRAAGVVRYALQMQAAESETAPAPDE